MNQRLLLLLFVLTIGYKANAQVTTSAIEGRIADEDNQYIPGVNIIAVHTPTGTQYGVSSMENGRYVLDNLKPGGPYLIKYSFIGLEDQVRDNIYTTLGQTARLDITMQEAAVRLDGVTVIANGNDPFLNDQSGIATNLDEQAIQGSPTLNRSLQDVTRLVPQGGQSSFGGSNYRYNNLSIDGASNNDVLGFQEPASGAAGSVASGTPGALAGTQPISLDAIQEVQVSIAPFDVQQGNFTGANINAVTRSGTNQVEGSVYTFGRNQWVTGKSVDESREPIADYQDTQIGFRIGAPIIKNKLFLFANYERALRKEPVLNIPGSPGTQIGPDIARAVSDTLRSRFGYDAGTFQEAFNERKSHKFFLRLDYNLGKNHQLTLRDNYVSASADNLDRGASFLQFGSQGFTHQSKTNSLVAELKSQFGNNVSNHLIIGYNSVNDERSFDGEVFPHIQITYNTANTIFAGTYREASIYGLTLNTTQFTDNLKIHKNKHTITLGTNNDLYNIEYRFLTAWNGRWEYRTLADFFNDQPSRVRGVYNYTDNSFEFNKSNPSADFRVMLLSAYIQDQYEVSRRLSFTGGIRIDMQAHPDKVPINPDVVGTPSFAHFDNDFGGVPQVNPRFAFNYTLNEKATARLRGGSGLFTGRIPFAWYAYSHYISGQNYGNIDLRPTTPLPITQDLSDLQNLQPGLTEVNLVDNDFKLPRTWRSSLAVDFQLPKSTTLTVEGMYSKALDEIWFKSINLNDNIIALEGADNRPVYAGAGDQKKINPKFTNVFLLTNTDKGYQYFTTVSATKKFDDNLHLYAAYTYGESKDLTNGVRNSMAANFNWNQAIDSNNPELTWSNFDVRHRIVSSLAYTKTFGDIHQSSFNLIYTGRSGFPFSYTVAGDLNNDGSGTNDLFYVPANESEVELIDITDENGEVLVSAATQWQQLDSYISNDPYLNSTRGGYTERNGARAPWNHQVDLRLAHQVAIGKKQNQKRIEVSLDIINFLSLINRKWGIQTFIPNVSNSSFQLIDFEGIEGNTPTFQFKNPQGTPWQTDQLNSRWQAQLGVRYSF